jgi:hypothetical protein
MLQERIRRSLAQVTRGTEMNGKGLYRTHGIGGSPNTVRVVDGSISLDVPENLYIQRRYSPDLEELPWNDAPPEARRNATSRRDSRRGGAQ